MNNELENLSKILEDKLSEVDEASRVNGQHVENLRELNSKLAMDVNSLRKENLEKIEEKINNLRKEIPNVKESDVEDLLKQRLSTEEQLKDLQNKSKGISDELLETQKVRVKIIVKCQVSIQTTFALVGYLMIISL